MQLNKAVEPKPALPQGKLLPYHYPACRPGSHRQACPEVNLAFLLCSQPAKVCGEEFPGGSCPPTSHHRWLDRPLLSWPSIQVLGGEMVSDVPSEVRQGGKYLSQMHERLGRQWLDGQRLVQGGSGGDFERVQLVPAAFASKADSPHPQLSSPLLRQIQASMGNWVPQYTIAQNLSSVPGLS